MDSKLEKKIFEYLEEALKRDPELRQKLDETVNPIQFKGQINLKINNPYDNSFGQAIALYVVSQLDFNDFFKKYQVEKKEQTNISPERRDNQSI